MSNLICNTCGRPLPVAEPVAVAEPVVEPVAEPVAAEPVVFHARFIEIVNQLPGTVLAKILTKLRRCDISPTTDSHELRAVLESATEAYTVKRNRAKVSSARARIAKKAAAVAAALAAAVETAPEPVAAPAPVLEPITSTAQ